MLKGLTIRTVPLTRNRPGTTGFGIMVFVGRDLSQMPAKNTICFTLLLVTHTVSLILSKDGK